MELVEHRYISDDYYFQRDVLERVFDDSVSPIDGNVVRTRNYSGIVSSYKDTGEGRVVDKVYRLYTNSYSYINSKGEAVMSATGSQHIDIVDGVVDGDGNDVDTSGYTKSSSFVITDSRGDHIAYTTQFANEIITLKYNGAGYDNEEIILSYNNSNDDAAGNVNKSINTRIQPTDEAYYRYVKFAKALGSSYRTDFESISPPPPKKYLRIQAGSQQDNGIDLEWSGMSLSSIGLGGANVSTQDGALRTIGMCDTAIEAVSEERSTFGAYQNRLEHSFNVNSFTAENLDASESRIRDTDMAEEMVRYTKQNILEQAVMSMLSQANQSQQGVLSLLAG